MVNHYRFGLTKTRAKVLEQQGYPFHVKRSITRSRPHLKEEFLATPILDEEVMLYSFKDEDVAKAFVAEHGGDPL